MVKEETREKIRQSRLRQPSRLIGKNGVTAESYAAAKASGMIWCRDCKQFLMPGSFGKIRSRCSECNRRAAQRHRDRVKLDPEAYEAWVKSIRKCKSQGPESRKLKNRRKVLGRYGVTPEWYDQKLSEQGGVCGICGGKESFTPQNGSFCIDHNHGTGFLRGLLCHRCNTTLERFDIEGWLDKALAYLHRYS